MKRGRITNVVGIIGLAALILLLTFSSPTEIGSSGVLLFFTTVYITVFCFISALFRAFYKIAFKHKEFGRKDYLYSAILAFGPIMLLMACSFSVVNPWTISLIIIFLCLAEFLVKKRV